MDLVEGIGTITLDGNVQDFAKGETILIPQGLNIVSQIRERKVVFIEANRQLLWGR